MRSVVKWTNLILVATPCIIFSQVAFAGSAREHDKDDDLIANKNMIGSESTLPFEKRVTHPRPEDTKNSTIYLNDDDEYSRRVQADITEEANAESADDYHEILERVADSDIPAASKNPQPSIVLQKSQGPQSATLPEHDQSVAVVTKSSAPNTVPPAPSSAKSTPAPAVAKEQVPAIMNYKPQDAVSATPISTTTPNSAPAKSLETPERRVFYATQNMTAFYNQPNGEKMGSFAKGVHFLFKSLKNGWGEVSGRGWVKLDSVTTSPTGRPVNP